MVSYTWTTTVRFPHTINTSPLTLCTDQVAPIEREIRTLANGLKSVKDEQEYIVVRERTHRDTAESTNERVKWWSIAQVIILILVVGWQVYYLKVCSSSLWTRFETLSGSAVLLRGQACFLGYSTTSYSSDVVVCDYGGVSANSMHHSSNSGL